MSSKITEPPFCPTCGRPNSVRHSPEWLLVHFSGIMGSILALLMECRRDRKTASMIEMCRAAYPDRSMPITCKESVKSKIYKHRLKLNELGWEIVGPQTTHAGWALVPVEQDH